MATCPAGHESSTDDYCDTCGALIGAEPTAPPPSAAPPAEAEAQAAGPAEAAAAPEAPAEAPCPNCGEPLAGQFCEGCGYNTQSGQAPQPATVSLALSADRAHWDRMVGSGEPAFPDVVPTMTFELTGDRMTLGRVSATAEPDVDIALTGPAADPGVSHHQCTFERSPDGDGWAVKDSGSANGTWVNDADEPLTDGQAHPLAEGDRILVGAWTCLTVQLTHPAPEG